MVAFILTNLVHNFAVVVRLKGYFVCKLMKYEKYLDICIRIQVLKTRSRKPYRVSFFAFLYFPPVPFSYLFSVPFHFINLFTVGVD